MSKIVSLSIFLSIAALFALLSCSSPRSSAPLPGSIYDPPLPIADFTLTDQKGQAFHFAEMTKGKVVLITFLYTHCTDTCPFIAVKIKDALPILGDSAKDLVVVVVSTDPERDTVPLIAAYSKDAGLYDSWHFLTGGLADVQKVWTSMKITVLKSDEAAVKETAKNATELGINLPKKVDIDGPTANLSDADIQLGNSIEKKFGGGYEVAHSVPFWFVDRTGNVRTSLDGSASSGQIAEAVKAVLKL